MRCAEATASSSTAGSLGASPISVGPVDEKATSARTAADSPCSVPMCTRTDASSLPAWRTMSGDAGGHASGSSAETSERTVHWAPPSARQMLAADVAHSSDVQSGSMGPTPSTAWPWRNVCASLVQCGR